MVKLLTNWGHTPAGMMPVASGIWFVCSSCLARDAPRLIGTGVDDESFADFQVANANEETKRDNAAVNVSTRR